MATRFEGGYGARDLTENTKEQARKAAEKLGQYQQEAQGLIASARNRVKSTTQRAWQYRSIRIFILIFGAFSGIPLALFLTYALIATCAVTGFAIISWLAVTAGALGLGAAVLSPVLFFTFCISIITLGGFLVTNFVYNVGCNVLGYFLGNSGGSDGGGGGSGEGTKKKMQKFIQRGGEKAREIIGTSATNPTETGGAGAGQERGGGATDSPRRESTMATGK